MNTASLPEPRGDRSSELTASPVDIDIQLLKREVDALQVFVHGQRTPWFKNISTLLSVIALIFSLGTTFVSYLRTYNQDIQGLRVELRNILQRLAALPKENIEMMKRYESDPAAIASISGFLNQENTLLARQAAEIARKIPSEYISATEYYSIAVALQFAYNVDGAKEFYTNAIDTANDMNDRVGGLRGRANLLFVTGQPDAGRVDFQRALSAFSEFQTRYDIYTKESTHAITEMAWAYSEAALGAKEVALLHIKNAEGHIATLIASPGANQLNKQVLQAKANIFAGQPLSTPSVVLPASAGTALNR